MSLVAPTDFTGIYKISQDQFSEVELQAYIDQLQPGILIKLFGVELYNLFFTATTGGSVAPPAGRFLTVYNAGVWQNDTSGEIFYPIWAAYSSSWEPCAEGPKVYQSYGIKDMLLGFIYYEYNRNNDVQATPMGNRTPDAMASNGSNGQLRNSRLTDAFNRAISSYQAIQWYMKYGENKADYPEYNGISLGKIFFSGAI